MAATPDVVTRRPAEVGGGIAAAVAAMLVAAVGIDDPAVFAPLVIVVGAVPGAITWLVTTIRG